MGKPKIIIVVEGGIVQSVHANTDIEYVVVDYDKHADEPVIVGEVNEPDTVLASDAKFHKEFYKEDSTDKDEQYVHEKLKELNF